MLTGLVVGKFSPLHKGHEALIEFARARCDQLIILSWSRPELPGCPPDRRATWLAALFPDTVRLVLDGAQHTLPENDAPENEQRAFAARVCRDLLGRTVDRVFTSEAYGEGFAASLARQFGHPVEHVMFDPGRTCVPVSGSQLRADTSLHRPFLSEPVRRDLVRRVAVIGGESSGKTTLTAALAAQLDTVWVTEYGRELWEQRGGNLRFDDLLAIAREQVAREERALKRARGWLICDTSPMVTKYYSEAMFDRVDPELNTLAKRRYDYVLLCAPDFPFVQDGTRRDADFRLHQDTWYRTALHQNGVEFHEVAGMLDQRLSTVTGLLTIAVREPVTQGGPQSLR